LSHITNIHIQGDLHNMKGTAPSPPPPTTAADKKVIVWVFRINNIYRLRTRNRSFCRCQNVFFVVSSQYLANKHKCYLPPNYCSGNAVQRNYFSIFLLNYVIKFCSKRTGYHMLLHKGKHEVRDWLSFGLTLCKTHVFFPKAYAISRFKSPK
jgi:hypothetical protein